MWIHESHCCCHWAGLIEKAAYRLVKLNAIIGVTVNPVPLEDFAHILRITADF